MKVIVFALNGCPAGWLGAYGNDWVGTPHLDRLAAEAVMFDRHISDRPEPDAARAAWLGGTLPFGSRLNKGTKTVLVRANHPDTDGPDWFYAGWGEVFDARPQVRRRLLRWKSYSAPSRRCSTASRRFPTSSSGSRPTASSRRGTCSRTCSRRT